jgi:hypothetical protein
MIHRVVVGGSSTCPDFGVSPASSIYRRLLAVAACDETERRNPWRRRWRGGRGAPPQRRCGVRRGDSRPWGPTSSRRRPACRCRRRVLGTRASPPSSPPPLSRTSSTYAAQPARLFLGSSLWGSVFVLT